MNRIFTLLLLVGALGQVHAQEYFEFISEDHRWHSQQGGFFVFNADQYFEGDTLIGDYTYHRFISVLDLAPDQPALDGLMREDVDEQRVYVWDGEQDQLLYDFDVEVGDTLNVTGLLCSATMEVASIETVIVFGEEREKINFVNDPYEYWIEGIGSVYSPMHPGFVQCNLSDLDPVIRCFYDAGELYWYNPVNTEDCAEIVTTVTDAQQSEVVLFPNPVQESLNLVVSNAKLERVVITDASGRVFMDEKMEKIIHHELDLSNLPAGMYFLHGHWRDASTSNSTFVKY